MKVIFRHLLGLLFITSGATTLILQVAWTKQLSYLLGNTLHAVATVVAAFMGGLGLGAWLAGRWAPRWKRPLQAYAVIECVIAVFAALSVPAFRSMESLFRLLHGTLDPGAGTFLLIRFAVLFAAMALPVTLMGMTLPVVAASLGRREDSYEASAAWFYGLNTVGATLGTFMASFALVPKYGLWRTCLAAAGLEAIVALAAWRLGTTMGEVRDIREECGKRVHGQNAVWTRGMWLIGGAYATSGFIAMIYEVGWFRLLGLVLGPSVHAFAVMLGIYLAGIGLGSLIGILWAKRVNRATNWFGAGQLLVGVLGLAGLALMNRLPELYFQLHRAATGWIGDEGYIAAHIIVAASLVFPPTLMLGVIFPLGVRAFREAGQAAMASEEAVGRLYTLNTVGAIVGSLAAGFFLIPRLGLQWTLAIAAAGSALPGVLLWTSGFAGRRAHFLRCAAAANAVFVVIGIAAYLPAYDAALFNQGIYRTVDEVSTFDREEIAEGQTLLSYEEGVNTTVAVFRLPGEANLRVAGKAEASTSPEDLYTQIFVGQLPMLFAREPRRAAVIGYGSGISAGSMLSHDSLQTLDVIELEKAVLDATQYFDFFSGFPLEDRRTRRILEDGRIHLTYSDKTYDVITSEPSNPWIAGVSNLFTVEFYERVKMRLSPRGMFGQWIQLYEMSEATLQVMLSSLHQVFPHVVIFLSPPLDMMMLASAEPITISWEQLEKRFDEPKVRQDFRRLGILSAGQLMFYLLASEEAVSEYVAAAQTLNTDDNVWLEHRMPREFFRKHPLLDQRLLTQFGPHRLRSLERVVTDAPLPSVLGEMVQYSYSPDFSIVGENFIEPITGWRSAFLESMAAELRSRGNAGLLATFEVSRRTESERYERSLRAMTQLFPLIRYPFVFTQSPVRAQQALRESIAADPDLPLLLLLLGDRAREARQYAEAERFYMPLLAKPWTSPHYDALLGLAALCEQRGDSKCALDFLERAMAHNPYHPTAFEQAARILIDSGQSDRASQVIAKALLFNPGAENLRSLDHSAK
jgi:spermidine synthase